MSVHEKTFTGKDGEFEVSDAVLANTCHHSDFEDGGSF